MILPKEMCDQISWYKVDRFQRSSVMYDRITIHFKQWWKRRKVIDIMRNEKEDQEGWWTSSHDCIELLNLLDQVVRHSWSEETPVTSRDGNVTHVDFSNKPK